MDPMLKRFVLCLSALLCALVSVGCDDPAPPEVATRSVAVAAETVQGDPTEFCDTVSSAADAPEFTLPEMASPLVGTPTGWRWVNVWATWCAPCVQEMPTLQTWTSDLDMELQLVSADATGAAVERFRARHDAFPATGRMAQADALPAWLTSLGLDEHAALPVHLLVDPNGKLRCARSGAVGEDDKPHIQALISSL
jgi:thiol-disulfide isomerase/thioredoxin